MISETSRYQVIEEAPSGHLEAGTGHQNVVMLHGMFGGPDNWWTIMQRLAGHYKLFAPQLPIDFNEDRRHANFRSLNQLTDFVARFMDDRQLDDFVLCGNSLGGQLALDYCLRHPERVGQLVLSGSAGLFENSLSAGPLRLSRALVRKHACNIFHDPVHVTDELVEKIYRMLSNRNYRRFLLRVAKATRDRYMLEELARVDKPTMVIWGRNDTITPPFVAEQFCDNIAHSRLVYLENCGHAPPIERPLEFAAELHAFLTAPSMDCHRVSAKPK